MARIVGEVEVTVPDDGLVEYGYNAGDTATIDENNIELFVRKRDTDVDFSNAGRMKRQQAYINGSIGKIMQMLKESPTEVWKKIEAMEYCMQTNITRSRYIDLTNTLAKLSYQEQDYYIPEGNYRMGVEYAEFYVNEDALLDKVVELFYIKR
jgi:anionic cell wall polymer biosynthesis LytR-Cps2A-Psr (LCP) family protein